MKSLCAAEPKLARAQIHHAAGRTKQHRVAVPYRGRDSESPVSLGEPFNRRSSCRLRHGRGDFAVSVLFPERAGGMCAAPN